jgi:hypothetical protein
MLLFLMIEMVVESRETVTSRKDHENPWVQHLVMGQGHDNGFTRLEDSQGCRLVVMRRGCSLDVRMQAARPLHKKQQGSRRWAVRWFA